MLAKHLKRIRRKRSKVRYEKGESDNVENESYSDDTDIAFLAYGMYMKEVIGAIIKKSDLSFNLEDIRENIAKSIKVTVDLSQKIYAFIDMAENASKAEDSSGNLSDLVYVKVTELQRIISEYLSPIKPNNIFELYLTQILNGIPEAQFEMETDVILTSNADILYLKLAIKLILETPPSHVEMFLWWSVVEDLILYTTSSMRRLYYDYTKMITGIDGSASRSSYCTASVNKLMGFAVSYLIIDKNFMTETRPGVEQMIENIRRSFNNLVHQATWMDQETKESTLRKSQKMKSLIGFPEWLLNQTRLELYYRGVSSHLHLSWYLDMSQTMFLLD